MEEARKVVFFDGGCLLCSSMVRWTHQRDHEGQIWFAALESEFAAQHREQLKLPIAGEGAETFVYWERDVDVVAEKSEGAFLLLRTLGGVWGGMGFLGSLFPLFLRDGVYDLIARNRRKWFGVSENCVLPPTSLRGRVLA